ncbi:MAG: hypothetical protein WCR55_08575 [Lentisphaerota bacterium]
MKNLLLGAIVALGLTAFAGTSLANDGSGSTPVQFSVWPGVTNWPDSYNVDGVKLDVPFGWNDSGTNQKVNGFEFGFFSQSRNVNGLQLTMLNLSNYGGEGAQIAFLNFGDGFKGAQISAGANWMSKSSGFQLGTLNAADANCKAVQVGAVNVSSINAKGAQIGVINSGSNYEGFQVGVLNIMDDEDVPGRKPSKGFQFGLINYMNDGFLPICILFNYSF